MRAMKMKLCLFGPTVRHTLIVMDAESGRRPTVRKRTFPGGAELLGDLVSQILKSLDRSVPEMTKAAANPDSFDTFAECRRYPTVLGKSRDVDDFENPVWRVDKLHGEKEISIEYKFSIGEEDELF